MQPNVASRIEIVPISSLRPNPRNARKHGRKQIGQLVRSIERFGFNSPLLVDDVGVVQCGNGRLEALKSMGRTDVPIIRLSHLSPDEMRAYALADNRIALNSSWDIELLAEEFEDLSNLGGELDLSLTGFSVAEIDAIIEEVEEADPKAKRDPANRIPALQEAAVTRTGDLWLLGRHKLISGDSRDPITYHTMMGDEIADMVFCDPPYNVPVDGHVCGKGSVQHAEFAMASGEMTPVQFIAFLTQTLGNAAKVCRSGAIAYVCMDWRHMGELLEASKAVFSELKNLCVWNKQNAGMGAFYRSKHELVFVFKVGKGEHVNTFGLGGEGRYRTNVWDYAGVTSVGADQSQALSWHPTVKPVAMVRDAICDCSHRGDIVLDNFGGSGTTLIGAHKAGRSARLIEFEPRYCDVTIRRFQALTGKLATLDGDGRTFEQVAAARAPQGGPHA